MVVQRRFLNFSFSLRYYDEPLSEHMYGLGQAQLFS